ncbi:MAG TPA: DNA repair protein RecO [Nitrospiraceae bacterium]|nr:DNA repair protein RecO [Nitrospiraceae bacterium]
MPLIDTLAIALKSRKWGEADRIVTFFTIRVGKIRGVARGARRQKSQFGGGLEPFVLSRLSLFEKPNDALYRIRHVDIEEPFLALRESLDRMTAAARLVNIVAAVTAEGDADAKIFEALKAGLQAVQLSRDPMMMAVLFQIRILGQTGFRPQIDLCAGCGRRLEQVSRHFSARSGGMVCAVCLARQSAPCLLLSAGTLALLQQAVRLPIPLVSRLRAEGGVRAELEAAIDTFATVVAGKRLPALDAWGPRA